VFKIIFPRRLLQRYYSIHYEYVLNIFKYLKCNVVFEEGLDVDSTSFKCLINDQVFIFDFADSSEYRKLGDEPIFKFHTRREDLDKVIPFPPVSFYDWDQYYRLEKEIVYNSENMIVSNRQRPYAGALERRTKVQNDLRALLVPAFLKTDIVPQEQFWGEVNEVGVFISIAGQNPFMIDRAPLQLMAFGCCVLSATIPEMLPFGLSFENCYWRMQDDYSDLVPLIQEYPKSSSSLYQRIGDRAKVLFKKTCTPEAIGDWIDLCLVKQ
jgi:hypothetical protein